MASASLPRAARVLVANAQEWFSRSLESILAPAQYTVVRAYTGPAALDLVRQSAPDAIILDLALPDSDGLKLCRTLRADPHVTASTPIILTTAGTATRQLRLDALRAGACELRSGPLDPEEFVLGLESRLRSKFDADRARDGGLTDPASGIYNAQGLARRAGEIASAAVRRHVVFACAVFVPEAAAAVELGDRLARAFRAQARTSDVVARLGPAEFAVLAPETDAEGIARLADRLARLVAGAVSGNGSDTVRLRAAHYALPEPPQASLDPLLLVTRARAALGAIPAP